MRIGAWGSAARSVPEGALLLHGQVLHGQDWLGVRVRLLAGRGRVQSIVMTD